MTNFCTIREAARAGILPENELRRRVKCGKLPGIYAGVKFLINVEMLMQQLDAECRANAGLPATDTQEAAE